ncbi:hypothetical protein DBR39_04890 [Chryseobacterium sp. KBW03]|nr:hypothetical protein DBR39_04890 [Chryseobacterium sp. KBW03]
MKNSYVLAKARGMVFFIIENGLKSAPIDMTAVFHPTSYFLLPTANFISVISSQASFFNNCKIFSPDKS